MSEHKCPEARSSITHPPNHSIPHDFEEWQLIPGPANFLLASALWTCGALIGEDLIFPVVVDIC